MSNLQNNPAHMDCLDEVEKAVEEYYMIFCHSVKTVPYHSTQTAVGEIDWLRTKLTTLLAEQREEMVRGLEGLTLPLETKDSDVVKFGVEANNDVVKRAIAIIKSKGDTLENK